jgi:hypothetical protein
LDMINKLSIKEYEFIDDKKHNKHYGLIAQEAREIVPHIVEESKRVIPNIYSNCKVEYLSDTKYKIILDKQYKLVLNNNELCLLINGNKRYVDVNEITKDYIIISTIVVVVVEVDVIIHGAP